VIPGFDIRPPNINLPGVFQNPLADAHFLRLRHPVTLGIRPDGVGNAGIFGDKFLDRSFAVAVQLGSDVAAETVDFLASLALAVGVSERHEMAGFGLGEDLVKDNFGLVRKSGGDGGRDHNKE